MIVFHSLYNNQLLVEIIIMISIKIVYNCKMSYAPQQISVNDVIFCLDNLRTMYYSLFSSELKEELL